METHEIFNPQILYENFSNLKKKTAVPPSVAVDNWLSYDHRNFGSCSTFFYFVDDG